MLAQTLKKRLRCTFEIWTAVIAIIEAVYLLKQRQLMKATEEESTNNERAEDEKKSKDSDEKKSFESILPFVSIPKRLNLCVRGNFVGLRVRAFPVLTSPIRILMYAITLDDNWVVYHNFYIVVVDVAFVLMVFQRRTDKFYLTFQYFMLSFLIFFLEVNWSIAYAREGD